MENKYIKAKEILERNNQNHIIKWMEQLDEETRKTIIDQVLNIDFKELNALYKNAITEKEKKKSEITPIQAITKEELEENEKNRYIEQGEKVLKEGKFAAVTMAGGQGTRLRT